MRIGIDVMGGDHWPHAPIGGLKSALSALEPGVELVLVGDQEIILAELERQGLPASHERYSVAHAGEAISMDEHAAMAIKAKKNSSIAIGLSMMKEGKLDAYVSAGNTGALMVGGVLGLGLIEGVSRPTIGALYPHKGRYAMICDVGANTDCKPEQLIQFGLIGSVFMQNVFGIDKPRVALINIGEERSKGNQVAQAAFQLFEQHPTINFVGNAEGRDLNRDMADVYVVDGFTGNILLKFGESFYPFLKEKLPNDPEIESFNFEQIGGLPIIGVKGTIMVGHGISGPLSFHNMIFRSIEIVRSNLTEKIARAFAEQ